MARVTTAARTLLKSHNTGKVEAKALIGGITGVCLDTEKNKLVYPFGRVFSSTGAAWIIG